MGEKEREEISPNALHINFLLFQKSFNLAVLVEIVCAYIHM